MIVASINLETKSVSLISFMRDLYVQIPGYSDNRLNAAYVFGGFPLLKDTLYKNFGITIDGSFDVLTRMAGINFVHRHPMRLIIHKPIYPTSHSPEDIRRTMDESYRVIMSALPEKYQGYVKNEDQ